MVVSSIPGRRTIDRLVVGTETGERLRTGIPLRQRRPTQPPTLCVTGNEYRSKCGDALRLEVKGRWLIPFVDKRVGGR